MQSENELRNVLRNKDSNMMGNDESTDVNHLRKKSAFCLKTFPN